MPHGRGHDLSFTLDGVERGFDLYWEGKDPPLTAVSQATTEDTAAFIKRDLPRSWSNWTGGAFHSISPQLVSQSLYGSPGEFGSAPPVYAYTKNMRMRDAGVASPSGLAAEPTIWTDATLTVPLGLRGVPLCTFTYNGHLFIIISNGDVLKSFQGISEPYYVTNLLVANALNVWSEAGAGSKTATKTTYPASPGFFTPVRVVPFNGKFYLVGRDAPHTILMFDGTNSVGAADETCWFVSSATCGVADTAYWVKNSQGFDWFVAKASNSTIKYTKGNPLQAGEYSAEYAIGEPTGTYDSLHPITNVISTGRTVLVAKTDGIYTFDELGHAPNLTPHLRNAIHADNGKVALVLGHYAYFWFYEGLYRIELRSKEIADVGGWVTPSMNLPNRTPINGTIVALAQDLDWLAAIIYVGTHSYLGYGRERTAADPPVGPMIWHFSEYDHDGKMSFLCRGVNSHPNFGNPRMWMGGSASPNFLVSQYLPLTTTALGDFEPDGPIPFQTSGEIYLPDDSIGDTNALKYLMSSSMQGDRISPSYGAFEHQIRMRSSDPWTSVGTCTDPQSWIGLPPEGFGGGYLVQQRLLMTSQTTDYPPSLYALRSRFAILPQAVATRKYRIKIGRDTQSSSDGLSRKSLQRQWATLIALTKAGKIRGHDRVLGDHLLCRVEQEFKATPIAWSASGPVAFVVEIEVTIYGQGADVLSYADQTVATFTATDLGD